jgi:signal peptidase II
VKPVNKWLVLALISGAVVVGDQVSKFLAVEHLTYAFQAAGARTLGEKLSAFVAQTNLRERGLADVPPVQVISSFWQFTYAQNRAAAFGMFSFAPEWFRVPFFYVITIAAVIFIVGYFRKLAPTQRFLQFTLALVLGGAIGNGVDRLLHGYVIDFIDWHWFDPGWRRPSRHWPTFNVADSALSVGLALLAIEMFFARKEVHEQAGKAAR